jgi:hypothetical protein
MMRKFFQGLGCGILLTGVVAGGAAWSQGGPGGPYTPVQGVNVGITGLRSLGVICVDANNMYDRAKRIVVWRENGNSADVTLRCEMR